MMQIALTTLMAPAPIPMLILETVQLLSCYRRCQISQMSPDLRTASSLAKTIMFKMSSRRAVMKTSLRISFLMPMLRNKKNTPIKTTPNLRLLKMLK